MNIFTKNTYYNTLSTNLIYQNYHKHTMYTNVLIVDSATYPEEYAKRAVELGHGIISSCEHGYQGRYIESFELAKEYNLKYLFAVEAYFVYDRFESDSTNAHMVLMAKNENGRKAINRILSEANLTGFYYRARIDYDLLMSLPENDVWITTACIGGINKYNRKNMKSEKLIKEWFKNQQYESPYEMLVDRIHQKFGDNFYLEVQAHHTDPQVLANQKMIEYSKLYGIEIIAGVDSHYIDEADAWKRDYLQKSSGIFMDEESGWFMDYPDGQTLFNRFKKQGVLSDDEIKVAISNTNVFLEVEEYTSPIFNHEMKMPSAPKYKNMTKEEKQLALMKIVRARWDEVKKDIPEEKHAHYMREIAKELDIIFKIDHADYFLLNYEIIKDAVENRGGMITFSGRGSGPSFYVNHLLGFTQIDRISSPITLYPERFLSTSRMSAGSLADIDFNCGNTPIFEESQKDILGEDHAYPMIAYGKLKPKAAWKMYCRAVNVPFDISNEISSKIDAYESDLKYWDEESGEDEPNVLDYIPDNLQEYFLKSKEFLGLIDHASRHPCFIGETLVKTDKGYKQIKDIQVGEKVLSHDGKYHEVLKVMKRDITEDLLKFVTYENNSFIVTKNHPILTDVSAVYDFEQNRAFMPAMLFKTGDKLFSPDNHMCSIKDIQKIKVDNTIPVYNLNVNITNTYTVTTDDIIVHNCGNILLTQDIKEEVGIVRLKSKGGRETICAVLDGLWCEKYLMLKNDLLTVTCVRLVYDLYKRINIPYMSLNKLLEEVKEHPEVWDMYEKGYVVGLNQVEKNSTKRKVMRYKPKNISELSAFIAGIRPAFKSLVDKLVNREHFEYGIPTLDNLLQTEELPESFILYQEQIMKILAFAGIPMGDCYTVIKSISKKRFEKIMHYKEQFLTGMSEKLIEAEGIEQEQADEVAHTIWGIIEDASAYGFNSSHSLSVSFDSLLAAYFKALYPIEFYEVYLNLQMEKAKKDKAFLAQQEMKEAFNIVLLPMRFGQDNRQYTAYPEQNAISMCMKSIKGFGQIVGKEMYRLGNHKFDTFIDLLIARENYVELYPIEVWNEYTKNNIVDKEMSEKIFEYLKIFDTQKNNPDFLINNNPLTLDNVFSLETDDIVQEQLKETFKQSKELWKIKVNDTQMQTLIKLGYFEQYGKTEKVLKTFDLFTKWYGKKILKKDKVSETGLDMSILEKYIGKETKCQYSNIDFCGYIKEVSDSYENKDIDVLTQLKFERELFEIPIYRNSEMPETWCYVMSFKTYGDKVNTPYLILYNLHSGDLFSCSINKSKIFKESPFGIYSIIDAKHTEDIPKRKKVGDKWVVTNETKTVLTYYEVIKRNKDEELNEVLKES